MKTLTVVKAVSFAIVTIILIYATIQTYFAQTRAAVAGNTGGYVWYYVLGGIIVLVWFGVGYLLFKNEIDEHEKNNNKNVN